MGLGSKRDPQENIRETCNQNKVGLAKQEFSQLPLSARALQLCDQLQQSYSRSMTSGHGTFFCRGGQATISLPELAHQKALEKSLGIKEQSFPVQRLSPKTVW